MYNYLPDATGKESADALKNVFEKESSFAELKNRSFLLDNFIEDKTVTRPKRGVGSKTAKANAVLPSEEVDFNLYLPLHELWKQYISELLEHKCLPNSFSAANVSSRLIKADMHGALISVWKASCNSYKGHKGIVIQETRRSFRVITPQNKVVRRI